MATAVDTSATTGDQPKYLLRVTAGPSYDLSTHVEVPVNLPFFQSSSAASSSSTSSSCSSSSCSSSSSSSCCKSGNEDNGTEDEVEANGERNEKHGLSKGLNAAAAAAAAAAAGVSNNKTEVKNDAGTVRILSEHCEAHVAVRVHNFRGIPRDAPSTSAYFQSEPHASRGDTYSIAVRFRLFPPGGPGGSDGRGDEAGEGRDGESDGGEGDEFYDAREGNNAEENGNGDGDDGDGNRIPTGPGDPADPATYSDEEDEAEDSDGEEDKNGSISSSENNSSTPQPPAGVPAADLQFGNTLGHPVRDRLPPGINTALNIIKWFIDPGLEGDVYADEPYLFGPALSSFNTVHVGKAEHDPRRGGLWVEEGGDEEGKEWRRKVGAPDDGKQRSKWALSKQGKEKWVWEYGRWYAVDFFNPYFDFGELEVRLPGFRLPVIKYWDGQGVRGHRKRSHQLRYVLRNRATGQVYLVVLFTLHLAEDVEQGLVTRDAQGTTVEVK